MMKEVIKQEIVPRIFSKIPLPILGSLTRTNVIIGYYHVVSDDQIMHINHLYPFKNTRQFRDDLEFLLKNYSPISLLNILDFLKTGNPLPKNSFLLTFDDGLREINDIVVPILLQKGMPATLFINSAFIDNNRLCYQHKASILAEHFKNMMSSSVKQKIKKLLVRKKAEFKDITSAILSIEYQKEDLLDEIAQLIDVDFTDYLSRSKPYLTSDQIKRMIKDGFTIGAHSIDHPLYSTLSLDDQLYQTIQSIKLIKERFCLNYGAFAFPNSDRDLSTKFFHEIYRGGLVDVSFGNRGMLNDNFSNHLQRFSLEKPLMPAERIIALQYAKKLVKLLGGNVRIKRP